MDDREPLALLTEISYLDKEEWLEIRLETRNGNKSISSTRNAYRLPPQIRNAQARVKRARE